MSHDKSILIICLIFLVLVVLLFIILAPILRDNEDQVDDVFQELELSTRLAGVAITRMESDEQVDEQLDEAARLVVSTQDCSRQRLQRTLGIGYARTGLILDQLEAAGIIGPMDEAQQQEVLMKDLGYVEPTLSLFGFLPGSHEMSDQEPKVDIDDMYWDVLNE